MRASPTPSTGSRRGVGEVQHDPRAGFGYGAKVQLLDLEVGSAGVDEALVPLGTGHRDLLLVV
jgi:hypothetical protein